MADLTDLVRSQTKQIESKARQIVAMKAQLDDQQQVGRRQVGPFSKGPPKADPKPQGRKLGDEYGEHKRRDIPEQIDETHDVPLAVCVQHELWGAVGLPLGHPAKCHTTNASRPSRPSSPLPSLDLRQSLAVKSTAMKPPSERKAPNRAIDSYYTLEVLIVSSHDVCCGAVPNGLPLHRKTECHTTVLDVVFCLTGMPHDDTLTSSTGEEYGVKAFVAGPENTPSSGPASAPIFAARLVVHEHPQGL